MLLLLHGCGGTTALDFSLDTRTGAAATGGATSSGGRASASSTPMDTGVHAVVGHPSGSIGGSGIGGFTFSGGAAAGGDSEDDGGTEGILGTAPADHTATAEAFAKALLIAGSAQSKLLADRQRQRLPE